MQSLICDGATEAGYLAAVPRLHDAVRFTYRPMLHEHKTIILTEMQNAKPGKKSQVVAAAVAKFVVSWDVTDKGGKPAPITAANALRLRPSLLDGIYNIVSGWAPSDLDPEASDADTNREAGSAFEALMSDQSIGQQKDEGDAKN